MDTDDLTVSGRRVLSVFIRVYPRLKIKLKKKKVAFPGRTWQIDPVTRQIDRDALPRVRLTGRSALPLKI